MNPIFTLCIVCIQLCLIGGAAFAAPPKLEMPIRCTVGQDCFIQNYVDHDPGAGAHDYTCGKLTYDGHHGTDFRLRDLAAMRRQVAVVASAPGVVVGVRDGEADVSIKQRTTLLANNRMAGNGVRVDHGDGWFTRYSHLLKGSIRVTVGQKVQTGDVLGMVGLSGNTEFPHVDFSVWKDGTPVDPFNPDNRPCRSTGTVLWSNTAMEDLRYQATGLLISGFAPSEPRRDAAQNGDYQPVFLTTDAAAISYWVELFGLFKGDRVVIELFAPDGRLFSRNDMVMAADKAAWFAMSGKRRTSQMWPAGMYQAHLRLERRGILLLEKHAAIEIH